MILVRAARCCDDFIADCAETLSSTENRLNMTKVDVQNVEVGVESKNGYKIAEQFRALSAPTQGNIVANNIFS